MISAIKFHYLLKYIVVGDSAVGKSNLLLKYCQNKFNEEYQATIGVEFGAKNIDLDGKIFRIQVWDTAGQESFRSITRAYFKNTAVAVIVYDITKPETFDNVQTWIEESKDQSPKTITLVLVGNKSDLESKRAITYEQGKELADQNKIPFFETSAKTGANVDQMFNEAARIVAEKIEEGYYDIGVDSCGIKMGISSNTKKITLKKDPQKKGYCC